MSTLFAKHMRKAGRDLKESVLPATAFGRFQKMSGPILGGPYSKDSKLWGSILGSPIDGHHH